VQRSSVTEQSTDYTMILKTVIIEYWRNTT